MSFISLYFLAYLKFTSVQSRLQFRFMAKKAIPYVSAFFAFALALIKTILFTFKTQSRLSRKDNLFSDLTTKAQPDDEYAKTKAIFL